MLTPEEQLEIGLRVLQRIGPALRAKKAKLIQDGESVIKQPKPKGATFRPANRIPATANLTRVIQLMGLPAQGTMVLGLCEDELPLTLDLNDPAPGSLLVLADPGCGKTRLLRSVLSSLEMINSPGQAVFQIITSNPADFRDLARNPHCQRLLHVTDRAAWNLVAELSRLEQQRRQGSTRGPAMVLAIDDLPAFLQHGSDEEISTLVSLVTHGPQARIRVIATVDSTQSILVDEQLLSSFQTRIFGAINDSDAAATLTGNSNSPAGNLAPGAQFCTPFDGSWIRFWACNPE